MHFSLQKIFYFFNEIKSVFAVFQDGSGNDLALLMIECFRTAHIPVGDSALEKIRSIFEFYEPGSLNRYEFIREAIK